MENLEWSWLIPTFLQVIGLAIGLTVVGFGYESAIRETKSLSSILTQTRYANWLAFGGVIFALGLGLTRMSRGYKAIGILLAGLLVVLALVNRASTMDDKHKATE